MPISSASTDTIRRGTFTPLGADTTRVPQARFTPLSREEDAAFLAGGDKDETTGAPMNLRMAVAAVRRPAQKLEIIRKVDPNAQPYGNGNFVYTPPGASQPILFDPKGFRSSSSAGGFSALGELGKDIMEGLPFLSELGGSIAGGTGGFLVGGPVGAVTGAGVGGAAARDLTEQGMMAAAGQQDPRTMGQRFADVAVTGAASGAGEGAGRLVAPIGRVLGDAAEGTALARTTRAAAERLSVPLTAGMASGRKFFQIVEGALSSNPLTGGMIDRAVRESTDAATGASRRIVQTMANGANTSQPAFVRALNAAGEGRLEYFKIRRQALSDALTNIVGSGPTVPMTNVQRVLNEMRVLQTRAGGALDPQLAGVINEANTILDGAQAMGGMLPFDVVQKLRTRLGEASSFGGMTSERVPGATQGIRDLWAATGEDLRQGAKLIDSQALAAGLPTPGAEQALEIHDTFVRVNRDADAFVNLDTMEKLMNISPKHPARWAEELTKNPEAARELRRSIPAPEWDTLAGSVFEDMGRATPGAQDVAGEVWSPSQFLSNWDRLGREGREALFGGTRYAGVSRDIQDLATVAQAIKSGSKYVSTSNSVGPLLIPLMLGTAASVAAGGPVKTGAAAGLMGAYAAAKILTSPRVMSTIRDGVVGGARRGPSFLARLVAIGRADQALRGPINEYIAAIGQAGFPLPDPRTVEQLNTGSPAVQFTPR